MKLPKYLYVGVGIACNGAYYSYASECENSVYTHMNNVFEDGVIVDFVVRKVVNR